MRAARFQRGQQVFIAFSKSFEARLVIGERRLGTVTYDQRGRLSLVDLLQKRGITESFLATRRLPRPRATNLDNDRRHE